MSSCRGRWTFALAGLFWSYACGDTPGASDGVAPSAGGTAAIDASGGDAGIQNGTGPGGGAAGGGTGGTSAPSRGTTSDGIDTDLGLDPSAAPTTAGGSSSDAGAAAAEPTPGASAAPLTVYLAGDSIVQTYADTPSTTDQAGWGQMLHESFDEGVTIENRAVGGRTARRFIDEGHLDEVSAELEAGDYLLIEFGTNDGNRTATYSIGDQTIPYFLDPATDFKTYLVQYIDAARSHEAIPVLVTPTPRNSAYCTGGNGTGAHANAMRELGRDEGVTVVDLNARSVAYLTAICPAPNPETFFLLRPDGTVDGTHFQERGARVLAGFVAEGLRVLPPFDAHFLAP